MDSLRYRHVLAAVALAGLVVFAPGAASAGSEDVASLYRQSYRLEAQGKALLALAAMRKVQRKAGSSYFAVARIAWLAHLGGRYAESEASYRQAISLASKAVEPRLGLTLPLLAQKKWRDLERACRDVLALDSNHATARARLAHAHYMVKNYPDSATVYRKLVAEYPANLDYQTGLAWALARMGRVKEGKQMFRAVLAVSPDNPNALQGMALP